MLNEKELISKTISDKEVSEITAIIKKNKISEDDEVIIFNILTEDYI